MMLLETVWFPVACLCVVIAFCVLGVFSNQFDDTLTMRVGLFLVALGALAKMAIILHTRQAEAEASLVYAGLSVYAAGTALQVWRRWRAAGRPDHPVRRHSDFISSLPAEQPAPVKARA